MKKPILLTFLFAILAFIIWYYFTYIKPKSTNTNPTNSNNGYIDNYIDYGSNVPAVVEYVKQNSKVPVTIPDNPKPAPVLKNERAFVKGQKVTVKKGVNLRSTNPPYSVSRKTASAESGWTLNNNPYLNTIEGIKGTWCVIYKDVVSFSSNVFVPGGNQSKQTTRLYHVVNTTTIL